MWAMEGALSIVRTRLLAGLGRVLVCLGVYVDRVVTGVDLVFSSFSLVGDLGARNCPGNCTPML